MVVRTITDEETEVAQELLGRARAAMQAIESYDQAQADRLCRAVAWAGGNEKTAVRLANMSVDETGMGSREPGTCFTTSSTASPLINSKAVRPECARASASRLPVQRYAAGLPAPSVYHRYYIWATNVAGKV